MADCPDLPSTCAGLSECCDRKHGTWLYARKCASCDSGPAFFCVCESYVRHPGALAGIIIGIIVVLLVIYCWSKQTSAETVQTTQPPVQQTQQTRPIQQIQPPQPSQRNR